MPCVWEDFDPPSSDWIQVDGGPQGGFNLTTGRVGGSWLTAQADSPTTQKFVAIERSFDIPRATVVAGLRARANWAYLADHLLTSLGAGPGPFGFDGGSLSVTLSFKINGNANTIGCVLQEDLSNGSNFQAVRAAHTDTFAAGVGWGMTDHWLEAGVVGSTSIENSDVYGPYTHAYTIPAGFTVGATTYVTVVVKVKLIFTYALTAITEVDTPGNPGDAWITTVDLVDDTGTSISECPCDCLPWVPGSGPPQPNQQVHDLFIANWDGSSTVYGTFMPYNPASLEVEAAGVGVSVAPSGYAAGTFTLLDTSGMTTGDPIYASFLYPCWSTGAPCPVTDPFNRTVSGGWGGGWTLNRSSGLNNTGNGPCFSVNGTAAIISGDPANVFAGNPFICLPIPTPASEAVFTWDWNTVNINNSEPQFYLTNAANPSHVYGADLFFSGGTAFLDAVGRDGSGANVSSSTTPFPLVSMGQNIHMKMQLLGRRVSLKAWVDPNPEPAAYQVIAGDPLSSPVYSIDTAYFFQGFLATGVSTAIETVSSCLLTPATWPFIVDTFDNRTVGPHAMNTTGTWLGVSTSGVSWGPASGDTSFGTTLGGVDGNELYFQTAGSTVDATGASGIAVKTGSLVYGATEVFLEYRWRFTGAPTTGLTGVQNRFALGLTDIGVPGGSSAKVYCEVFWCNCASTTHPQITLSYGGSGLHVSDLNNTGQPYTWVANTWYRTKLHFQSGVKTEVAIWPDGGSFPGYQLTQTLPSANLMTVRGVTWHDIFVYNGPAAFQLNLIQFDQT